MSFLDGGGLNGYGDYTGADAATQGTQFSPDYVYSQDYRDAAKLDPYVPVVAGAPAAPWWERVAQYGLTRAIDSQYGPTPTQNAGALPGTFAGQNGQTYRVGNASNTPVSQQNGLLLPLLLAAGVALFALS